LRIGREVNDISRLKLACHEIAQSGFCEHGHKHSEPMKAEGLSVSQGLCSMEGYKQINNLLPYFNV